MAVTKVLSLKTISGLVVGGATVGSAFALKNHFSFLSEESGLDNFSIRELIDKAGLDCGLTDDEELTEAKSCKVKENRTIGVKKENLVEEAVTYSNETSSLKVSRSRASGYTKNLKFVVDSGDIDLLAKGGSAATKIPKLEQFETYDIRKIGDRFYLLRRTAAKREILKKLGLPARCTLPDEGDSECSLTPEEIKRVRFRGLTVATTEEVNLKISKMEDSTDFPDGYRFTFRFPGDLTIGNRDLKANTPYDFRIKEEAGNAISLERAWTDDSFTKKAGLVCNGNKECTVSSEDQKLNVRVGEETRKGIESIDTSSGKIKMETEQTGYNQGLKFTIRDGDVSLGDGEGEIITKLEELETYEIKEEKGEYFLTRLINKEEPIKKSLVLPKDCELPTGDSVECSLNPDDFKALNFDGKSGETFNGESMTLRISSGANREDFPFGYRFTFETTSSDATVTTSTNIIKANIPTDFKIKKTEERDGRINLSLERTWNPKSLGEKAGLICQSSYEDECSFLEEKLNVMVEGQKVEDKTATSSITEPRNGGRIIIEKDKLGYNQGFKFTIDKSSFTLSGGTGDGINTLEEYETYEIKEEGDKYYLTRKTTRDDGIKTSLVLPSGCELPTSSSGSKNCSLSIEEFKNINFEGKGEDVSAGAKVDLKISNASLEDFPLGYKFTFNSEEEAKVSSSNTIDFGTPTDFRIKRVTGDQKTTLSLERAWDNTEFTAMVGLDCTDSNGTECSVRSGTSGKLNIKKGNEKKEDIEDIDSDPNAGKIKVEKGKNGYNQGLKFTITGGDVNLTGGKGGGTFTTLDEYEIYEIKEEGDKYYLTRKSGPEGMIISSLALPHEGCDLISSNTPVICTLTKDDFQKINFDDKSSTSSNGDVTLTISKADNKKDFPFGYKFTFSTTSSASVTTSTETINVNDSIEFKIKKGSASGPGQTPTLTLEKKK